MAVKNPIKTYQGFPKTFSASNGDTFRLHLFSKDKNKAQKHLDESKRNGKGEWILRENENGYAVYYWIGQRKNPTTAQLNRCKKLIADERAGRTVPTITYHNPITLDDVIKAERRWRAAANKPSKRGMTYRGDIEKEQSHIAKLEEKWRNLAIAYRNQQKNARGYTPFSKKETKERYEIAVRQLKEYPFNWNIREEIERYGKALGYSQIKIAKDLRMATENPTYKFYLVNDTLNIKAQGNDYDKLQDAADRLNEKQDKERYFVMSAKDRAVILSQGFKTKQNFTNADFKSFQKQRINELHENFKGEASRKDIALQVPDSAPQPLSVMGKLVLLKYKNGNQAFNINFTGQSYLLQDIRKNLWVGGKGAKIQNVANPTGKELKFLGDLIQVDYVTRKNHIENGQLIRFWHPLGEVDGQHPKLYIDADKFPVIHGGGYDIWKVGIVN